MRKAKLLSILLALAMVLTALVPATVQAAGKTVTVGTQAELEEALKDPEVTKIAIKAKKGKTLTIPEGDYEHVALVVDAAKVKLNNYGTFRVVKVRDAISYTEHAAGNTIKVTAPTLDITVAETAAVEALFLQAEDGDHTVEIKGDVTKVTVTEESKVELTVDGTLDTLNVKKAAEVAVTGTTEETITVNTAANSYGAKVETEVAVDVKAKDFVEVIVNEGAENTTIVAKTEAADVKVENKTEVTINVEVADGTVVESTSDKVVDTREPEAEEPKVEEPVVVSPVIPVIPNIPVIPETPVEPEPVVFTVTIDDGKGNSSSTDYEENDIIETIANPTCDGYVFEGWCIDEEPVVFPYTVTGTVTITAKWSNAPGYAWDEESFLDAVVTGGSITLRDNITLTQKLTVENDVILNLNGKTLTTYAVDGNYGVIVKADLTINGDGNVAVGGLYGIGVTADGNLTINGGNFTHAGDYMIGLFGGTATINDGNFQGNYNIVNAFTEYAGSYAQINGGTFTVADIDPNYEESAFFGEVYVKNVELGNVATETTDEAGFTVSTEEDLLNAIVSGGSITLDGNIVLTQKLTVDKDVVLNLNGKTLTTYAENGNYGVVVKANLTINGEGNVEVGGLYGIGVTADGNLTINGGNFTHTGDYMIGLFGGTATINNGSFQGNYNIVNAFTEYAGSYAQINGGTFTVADIDPDYEESAFFGEVYVK